MAKSNADSNKAAVRLKADYERFHSLLGGVVAHISASNWSAIASHSLLSPLAAKVRKQVLAIRQSVTNDLAALVAEMENEGKLVVEEAEVKNRYALGVVKRVKSKLDGQEADTYAKSAKVCSAIERRRENRGGQQDE